MVPVLALAALPFIGSPSTWVTLTMAGLAMGMIIFTMASGLTLVFGLMDVLNFGHGAFISVGAYVANGIGAHDLYEAVLQGVAFGLASAGLYSVARSAERTARQIPASPPSLPIKGKGEDGPP